MFSGLSKKIVYAVALNADDLFVEPAFVAAAEDDEAIFLLVHDLARFEDQFLEFDFADLALEDGVLNPVEVAAAEFEHFGNAGLVDVVNGYDVHGCCFFLGFLLFLWGVVRRACVYVTF